MNPGEGPSSPLGSAKSRLTEEQKKRNHIESEKKRREAIRNGFDRLSTIVPGMQGQARSEAIVLAATVDHMRAMIRQKEQIQAAAMSKGWTIDQLGRYYQIAEQEARANESAPLQLNAAGIPVAIQALSPQQLQQVQQQQQQQPPQMPVNAYSALPGSQPTPVTTATAAPIISNGNVPAPDNGADGNKSRSDSPSSPQPVGD